MKTTSWYALGFLSFFFGVSVVALFFNLSSLTPDIFKAMYAVLAWLFFYLMLVFFIVAWFERRK